MLQRPGQHVELQAQLLSICHMAVCDATERLASPFGASSSRGPEGQREDDGDDGEGDEDAERDPAAAAAEALLTALTALRRMVALRLSRVCWGGRAPGQGGSSGSDSVAAEVDAEGQAAELEATVDVLQLHLHVMQQVRPASRRLWFA